jgi:hypothetical protein
MEWDGIGSTRCNEFVVLFYDRWHDEWVGQKKREEWKRGEEEAVSEKGEGEGEGTQRHSLLEDDIPS